MGAMGRASWAAHRPFLGPRLEGHLHGGNSTAFQRAWRDFRFGGILPWTSSTDFLCHRIQTPGTSRNEQDIRRATKERDFHRHARYAG